MAAHIGAVLLLAASELESSALGAVQVGTVEEEMPTRPTGPEEEASEPVEGTAEEAPPSATARANSPHSTARANSSPWVQFLRSKPKQQRSELERRLIGFVGRKRVDDLEAMPLDWWLDEFFPTIPEEAGAQEIWAKVQDSVKHQAMRFLKRNNVAMDRSDGIAQALKRQLDYHLRVKTVASTRPYPPRQQSTRRAVKRARQAPLASTHDHGTRGLKAAQAGVADTRRCAAPPAPKAEPTPAALPCDQPSRRDCLPRGGSYDRDGRTRHAPSGLDPSHARYLAPVRSHPHSHSYAVAPTHAYYAPAHTPANSDASNHPQEAPALAPEGEASDYPPRPVLPGPSSPLPYPPSDARRSHQPCPGYLHQECRPAPYLHPHQYLGAGTRQLCAVPSAPQATLWDVCEAVDVANNRASPHAYAYAHAHAHAHAYPGAGAPPTTAATPLTGFHRSGPPPDGAAAATAAAVVHAVGWYSWENGPTRPPSSTSAAFQPSDRRMPGDGQLAELCHPPPHAHAHAHLQAGPVVASQVSVGWGPTMTGASWLGLDVGSVGLGQAGAAGTEAFGTTSVRGDPRAAPPTSSSWAKAASTTRKTKLHVAVGNPTETANTPAATRAHVEEDVDIEGWRAGYWHTDYGSL